VTIGPRAIARTAAPPAAGAMAVTAAIAGNALEWFDFTVYGLFSIYIAKVFFPAGSELASLLARLATYGVGFVLRPIGAVVFGQYADRSGRRAALTRQVLPGCRAAGSFISSWPQPPAGPSAGQRQSGSAG
jgi:MFS family permease